ncbi:MAG TPA: hypothetical protein VIJ58_07730 [Candidatus Dormibacteraeota bacterium]
MKRELLSEDHVTRAQWPILFWANRVTLVGLLAGFLIWIGLLVYAATSPPSAETQSTVNGFAGLSFLLGALSGLIFIVTGYVRLYMVHRLPGRVPTTRASRTVGRAGMILAIVLLTTALLAGWVHWSITTAVVFVVVGGGLLLVQRWR